MRKIFRWLADVKNGGEIGLWFVAAFLVFGAVWNCCVCQPREHDLAEMARLEAELEAEPDPPALTYEIRLDTIRLEPLAVQWWFYATQGKRTFRVCRVNVEKR